MELLFRPRSESVLEIFDEIVKVYRGKEHYLFKVIEELVPDFVVPEKSRDYTKSLIEFKSSLRFSSIMGLERLLKIIEGLINCTYDEYDLFILEALLPKLRFATDDAKTSIVFNDRKYFAAEWNVPVLSFGQEEQQIIHLDLFDYTQTEIVPIYIVEYVKGAVLLYSQGLLKGACALMTIAMEATLRDILAQRGYTYISKSSSDDQYYFTDAIIDVTPEKDKFTLLISHSGVKSISEYCTANENSTQKVARIRRKKYGNNGKFELTIRDCENLVDYFSSNEVVMPSQKTISGLGAALNIARNIEKIIEVALLPKDMDAVFTGIRNNLIHLSGAGLSTAQVQDQKLEEFVNDRNKVFDLISFVPQFINAKFRELNR